MIGVMKRDYSSAVFELKQIAQCLALSSHVIFKDEIADINHEIERITKEGRDNIRLEFLISHLIMRAKARGLDQHK